MNMSVDPAGTVTISAAPRGRALRWARRAGVTLAGGLLLAVGAVMLVTPGPGVLVLLLALVVLATEYAWARRQLDRHRAHAAEARRRAAGAVRRVSRSARRGGDPRT